MQGLTLFSLTYFTWLISAACTTLNQPDLVAILLEVHQNSLKEKPVWNFTYKGNNNFFKNKFFLTETKSYFSSFQIHKAGSLHLFKNLLGGSKVP